MLVTQDQLNQFYTKWEYLDFIIRKEFLKDIIIIIFILITPFLFYFYLFFPETSTFETKFFTVSTTYYEDVQAFVWTFSIKFSFILMFSIWYVTCKHWWRVCLLIPIIFYVNQLIVVINDELHYVDQYELGVSLIISIPVITVLIILSKKLKYYSESKSLAEELDMEISQLFEHAVKIEKTNIQKIKLDIKNLRDKKSTMTREEYLKGLISIRDMIN